MVFSHLRSVALLCALSAPAAFGQTPARVDEAALQGLDGKKTIDAATKRLAATLDAEADGGANPTANAAVLSVWASEEAARAPLPGRWFGDGGVPYADVDIRHDDAGTPDIDVDAVAPRGTDPLPDDKTEALAQLIREQDEDRDRAEAAAKLAEAAQKKALERARRAKSALLEKILRKIAAGQGAKVALAEADSEMRDVVEAALVDARARLERASEGLKKAQSLQPGTGDAILDDTIAAQRDALSQTREAVKTRREAHRDVYSEKLEVMPGQDQLELTRYLSEEDRVEVNARFAELEKTVDEVKAAEDELLRQKAELWYQVADARLRLATVLNETRLGLLRMTSDARAAALRGLTHAGRDNLTVALDHVGTLFSFHLQRRLHDVKILPARLADPLYSGSLLWVLFKLALTITGALFVYRRGPEFYARVRKSWLLRITNRARVKLLESTLAVIEDAAPQAALLGLAVWTTDLLKKTGPEPELSTIFSLLIWIVSYQLAAKLTHRLVLRLARRRHNITVPQKLKVIRTVRTLMRFGFIAGFILVATASMVGEGILFAIVRFAVVVVGFILFLLVVRRWRGDIVQTYLAGWQQSALAGVIERNPERWFILPLAVIALVSVSVRAVVVLVRDFVLGFEQSRKALAYLFQVRVERKTKEQGRRVVDVEALPEVCRVAFADIPCIDPRYLVDRFADQAPLLERFKRDDSVSVLISAPAGGGATTWTMRLLAKIEKKHDVIYLATDERIATRQECFAEFYRCLGISGTDYRLDQIRKELEQRERPVLFVLDGVHRWFLRGLDGYQALTALTDVMLEAELVSSFIVVGHASAVRFLDKTRAFSTSFDFRIKLAAWTESEVRELVQRRQRTTKLQLSFEDLLVRELDGTIDAAHVVETENGYLRLLWSFAEGNPRTVLYFWLRSLSVDDDGLNVQLHDAPSADDLEVFPVEERFLLQATVLHRELTAAEMARATNLPLGRARAHVARAVEMGVYAVDEHGAITVRTYYWQSAVRYLRRKNML